MDGVAVVLCVVFGCQCARRTKYDEQQLVFHSYEWEGYSRRAICCQTRGCGPPLTPG